MPIFVIGMPRGLDGKPSTMSQVVEKIGAKLKATFPVQKKIYYQDERFTSTKDLQGITHLHEAAFSGSKEIVKLLLENNADLNVKSHNGSTALDLATAGHQEVVNLLLGH